MKGRTVSVGVDVDALKYYYQIHGLDPHQAIDAAWTLGVPRFLDLFEEVGCKGTFYCVASDLNEAAHIQLIRQIVAAGHEVGNHTLDHDYRLTQLSPQSIYDQVAESKLQLESITQSSVVGFRAPGYHINGTVLRAVKASGHRYDTSVFPCVPYYAAKAGIMGFMRLRGRQSKSILGNPLSLSAPRKPYMASLQNPYRLTQANGFTEFPISVIGGFPLIGTAFTAMGQAFCVGVTKAAKLWRQHTTIEFHAADLLSIAEDGLPEALSVQPDLRISWHRKRKIFGAVLKAVADGASFRRLDELVEEV